MELQDFKAFAKRHDNFEIRVISHAGSRFYQVELEDIEGARHLLTQNGYPIITPTFTYSKVPLKGAESRLTVRFVPVSPDDNFHLDPNLLRKQLDQPLFKLRGPRVAFLGQVTSLLRVFSQIIVLTLAHSIMPEKALAAGP